MCVAVGLTALIPVPIANMITLGYLLEASARVARTGRISRGFMGFATAARVGLAALGLLVSTLPLRFAWSTWRAAHLVDPAGRSAAIALAAVVVLVPVTALHTLTSFARGARFREFLVPRPLWLWRASAAPAFWSDRFAALREAIASLHLGHLFWLGLRGFAGGLLWVALPATLIVAGVRLASAGLEALGVLALAVVVTYIPFLQTRFALEDRFGVFVELGAVRRAFARAPLAFVLTLLFTLLLPLPLYLFKIEPLPTELAWAPALLFVALAFASRAVAGWAHARAARRATPSHFLFRAGARLALPPVALAYACVTVFTQYTSWFGAFSLYDQGVVLVPMPVLGL